jgi:hypothetical protein
MANHSDIFISYKREEQAKAKCLADALSRKGWNVWWDPKLRAGERYNDVIEQALKKTRCVIVLWSKRSVASKYVKDEARFALKRQKLIPVAIEEVDLPFRFDELHTVQLRDWDSDLDSSPIFQNLAHDIQKLLRSPPKPEIQENDELSGPMPTAPLPLPPATTQKISMFWTQLDLVFIVAVSYALLLSVLGITFEFSDPYLKFYMAGSGLWLLMFTLTMKYSAHRTQNILIKGICFLSAAIASAAVIWRYFVMREYCKTQTPESPPPFGFSHDPEYLPYVYVMGILLVIIVGVLLKYAGHQDEKYRTAVFRWIGGLIVWLMGCRVAWYLAERCYQVYK